jgi:glycosyltransferase involved in cell wall biosynthesis
LNTQSNQRVDFARLAAPPFGSHLRVALEADNLNLSAGTGIATYASNLAAELRNIGHAPMGVFGVKGKIGGRNEFLDEVNLFDARLQLKRPLAAFLRHVWYRGHGDPFGARARRLTLSGQVHQPSLFLSRENFEDLYGVPHLSLRAEMHFRRYGGLLRLRGVTGADAFHATHPIALALKGVPNLCTIHDIIPLRLPYATLDDKRAYYNLISLLVRKADKIVTVSEFSRRDLISVFKIPEERIVNTYQSVSLPARVMALSADEVARHLEHCFGLEYRNYFLFVGAIEPKKNVKRLIAGYAASGTNRPLVLAGGLGWQFEDDVVAMKDERFQRYRVVDGLIRPERSVRHLNYVSRIDLAILLRGARALVFPSLYEGFGLPVLEAMLAGTPVITSASSSLPELAGDAAEYVSPFEPESIARAIRTLDTDDTRCEELIVRGKDRAQLFSPKRYGERLAELYAAVQ